MVLRRQTRPPAAGCIGLGGGGPGSDRGRAGGVHRRGRLGARDDEADMWSRKGGADHRGLLLRSGSQPSSITYLLSPELELITHPTTDLHVVHSTHENVNSRQCYQQRLKETQHIV